VQEARDKLSDDLREQELLMAKKKAEVETAERLATAILSRGWKVTLPQIRIESK
jgi:hypothetical protein